MNTLATEGAKKFDFTVQNDGDDVKLKTKIVTATIDGTLVDADPLAVFKIDQVLLPRELFKAAPPAPAPKPAKSKKSKKSGDDFDDEAETPGPSADDEAVADEVTSNDGVRSVGAGFVTLCLSFMLGVFA